jgi:hypothetical protein
MGARVEIVSPAAASRPTISARLLTLELSDGKIARLETEEEL